MYFKREIYKSIVFSMIFSLLLNPVSVYAMMAGDDHTESVTRARPTIYGVDLFQARLGISGEDLQAHALIVDNQIQKARLEKKHRAFHENSVAIHMLHKAFQQREGDLIWPKLEEVDVSKRNLNKKIEDFTFYRDIVQKLWEPKFLTLHEEVSDTKCEKVCLQKKIEHVKRTLSPHLEGSYALLLNGIIAILNGSTLPELALEPFDFLETPPADGILEGALLDAYNNEKEEHLLSIEIPPIKIPNEPIMYRLDDTPDLDTLERRLDIEIKGQNEELEAMLQDYSERHEYITKCLNEEIERAEEEIDRRFYGAQVYIFQDLFRAYMDFSYTYRKLSKTAHEVLGEVKSLAHTIQEAINAIAAQLVVLEDSEDDFIVALLQSAGDALGIQPKVITPDLEEDDLDLDLDLPSTTIHQPGLPLEAIPDRCAYQSLQVLPILVESFDTSQSRSAAAIKETLDGLENLLPENNNILEVPVAEMRNAIEMVRILVPEDDTDTITPDVLALIKEQLVEVAKFDDILDQFHVPIDTSVSYFDHMADRIKGVCDKHVMDFEMGMDEAQFAQLKAYLIKIMAGAFYDHKSVFPEEGQASDLAAQASHRAKLMEAFFRCDNPDKRRAAIEIILAPCTHGVDAEDLTTFFGCLNDLAEICDLTEWPAGDEELKEKLFYAGGDIKTIDSPQSEVPYLGRFQ